ncbi:glycosyltransferase family 4 protein [Brevundimonas goettingensis]|uniref:Glycosyltransferase family 4 protein n=1 Tax=Brevundimonas goettingensis TaxID=2774190 RepID=A0A975GVY2_9CAUL|nr:glycosyltransferase family 4 protein [Brevundimonas goettingensis]QTC91178.1 glycosyltransferase family 4 protein [Brevundimonas goettingensis]
MGAADRPLQVVVVCPWFFRGDAVGAAARETYAQLAARPDMRVTGLWTANDYDEVKGRKVETLADLLLDPDFLRADVIVYVFAVYHPFFDAVLLGNGHAKQVVRFHNVTPKRLMPEKHWPVIEKSFVQIQAFSGADALWADSRENAEELARNGQGGARVSVVPLGVEFPARARLADKPRARIELLYVGRFFQSKGVHELIQAADRLRRISTTPFVLRLVGNLRFSDPDYVEGLHALLRELDLGDSIDFVGAVSDAEMAAAYRRAHVLVTGSRHEGFCVPVIEGLAAGCVPVSYAISNLRYIADGLGVLALDDTPEALAEALKGVIDALGADGARRLWLDRGSMSVEAFDLAGSAYVEGFTRERFGERIAGRVRDLANPPPSPGTDAWYGGLPLE